ncbi:kynurenine--oxoglutarate transaminase 3-like isoform X2 [Sycon ciliatum]
MSDQVQPLSPYAAKRIHGLQKNMWTEYAALALRTKSTNLGQGFPDFHAPDHVRQSLATATTSEKGRALNQYTRSQGHLRLVNALAKLYSPVYGWEVNPLTEIIVSVGGYGSLFYCIQSFINPGDEVVMVEPFFDCYDPMVRMAGGTPKGLPLVMKPGATSSADFQLDLKMLEEAFTEKTKMFIFNTPHNPTGKIFSRSELEQIAAMCVKHDVLCLSDEVYEWLVYDTSPPHIKIATLPGMRERTLTVGSAGKTFSATGWKTGWTVGPPELIRCLASVHGQSMYTCPSPLQEAVAEGLELEMSRLGTPECYLTSLAAELKPKRDWLSKELAEIGLTPIIPEGGYFLLVDAEPLGLNLPEDGRPEDCRFVYWLAEEKGIAVIPTSPFYTKEHEHYAKKVVRFCFCKEDSTLEKGAEKLRRWKASL